MKKVKVAVIGYGHLGRWHAQKADQIENSELIAIVEPSKAGAELAKKNHPNVKIVASLSEIISEIDAAVIVTPTSTHFGIVKDLLQNDKHVFCEKPLCSTIEDAKSLEEFLGSKTLQVGHSERCHQIWEKLIPVFKDIKGRRTIKIDRFAEFKGRATDVDVVSDLMIHDIDLMLHLFKKKPTKLRSIGHKIRTDKWDHVTSHFELEGGDEVIITSGRNHVKEVRSLEVMSDSGCHYVDLFKGEYLFATSSKFDDDTFVKSETYEKRDHLLLEQENFYSSILESKTPMVTYQDGREAVYYVSKVLESLETTGEIKL